MTSTPLDHVPVVGVPMDRLTLEQVVDTVMQWTTLTGTRVAVGVNASVCNLAATDPVFAEEVVRADLRYADGQSIVWASRLLGSPLPERVATTDLIEPLAALCAARGKRVFLYGSKPGVAERAAGRLRLSAPGLQVDSRDGYARAEEMPGVIEAINAFDPDILFVGLGDPLQQHWVEAHRDALTAPAILTCGGLFDWVSGDNPRAPRWMISSGFEWLWRLMIEPRRLAGRYLIGNPVFLLRLGRQLASARGRPGPS